MNLILGCTLLLGSLAACNSSADSTTKTGDSNTGNMGNTANPDNTTASAPAENTAPPMNAKTPLSAKDSTFVMKAAVGGMIEVESGKVAQENAASDRVKAYGSMMVQDHGKANSELASLASSKGLTVPAALPADKQKHVDDMKAMKGKSFDSHYLSMMTTDHKKDIAEFEKAASGADDADLKAWAAKTLPTLKMHMDSVQAISKAKM